MTVKELLKPRYKVIADYPSSPFKVGEILSLIYRHYSELRDVYITKSAEYEDIVWEDDFFDSYPHLFKKLDWWEERKAENMPQYIHIPGGEIVKVASISILNGTVYYPHKTQANMANDFSKLRNCLPATLEEYNNYINSKQQ
jgi:hypothetical protein